MEESTRLEENSSAIAGLLNKNIFGTVTRCKILIESSIFSVYHFFIDDNIIAFKAKRCLSGFEIFDRQGNFVCKMKANIFGTKYSLEYQGTVQIQYETSFLERGKPRCFKVKLQDLELINKKPFFNPETNSFSLNFSGRVTKPSVKNFQVVHPLEPTYITLTFGKEEHNSYILDFTYPWSALNAFCVGLSALDHKFGCD
ncbi:Tubby- protein 3 [Glugoides intestinalis]